jgi:hypothetical protein
MPGMARKKKPSDAIDYRRAKGWVPPKGSKPRGRPRKTPATATPIKSPPSAPAKKPPAPKSPPKSASPSPSFTRPRGRPRKLPPTLAELAQQPAPHLDAVTGGVCSTCEAEYSDADRCCTKCGTSVRKECPCGAPLQDGMQFCRECGKPAASKPAALAAAAPAAIAPPVSPPPPVEDSWAAPDMWPVTGGVELVITKLAGDQADEVELDDATKKRIQERAAIVANKHFQIGGRWKDEIQLGMAIVGAIWPAMYIGLVEIPREKRRAERERIARLEALERQQNAARGALRSVPHVASPTVVEQPTGPLGGQL